MTFEEVLNKIGGIVKGAGIIGKVSASSVLNSLIWIIGLFCLVIFGSFFLNVDSWKVIWLFMLLSVTLLSTVLAYTYFAKTDPDSLRSETYNLEVKRYQYENMGQKGKEISSGEILLDSASKNTKTKTLKGK